MSTDQRLEHLQSFNTNPQFFSVPEALRHGVPLLVLPGSGRLFTEAQLNPQLNIRSVLTIRMLPWFNLDHQSSLVPGLELAALLDHITVFINTVVARDGIH